MINDKLFMYYVIVRKTDGLFSPVAIVDSENLDKTLANLQLDYPDQEFEVIQLDLESLIMKLNKKAVEKSKQII